MELVWIDTDNVIVISRQACMVEGRAKHAIELVQTFNLVNILAPGPLEDVEIALIQSSFACNPGPRKTSEWMEIYIVDKKIERTTYKDHCHQCQ
jgi:hypothetical protein